MDKFKEILTKYWVGILCGVIALIAMIASIIPLGDYHDELHGKLQKSAENYNKLNNLMTQRRTLPRQLDQIEDVELPMFPSQSVIDSGMKQVKDLETQSRAAFDAMVDINRRQQLITDMLPNAPQAKGYDFRDAYNRRLGPGGTLTTKVLQAMMPPTTEQIQAEAKRRWDNNFSKRLIPDATGGGALNKERIDREYAEAMAVLPDQMRSAAAMSGKVYMAPTVLQMDRAVADVTLPLPRPEVVWWAQMALWVQEDIAAAIAKANEGAKNVTESRVKHILTIDVPIGPQMIFGKVLSTAIPGSGAPQPEQQPAVLSLTEPVQPNYLVSPSGRVSGPLCDVVHYRVEMIVSAKELPAVLASFSDKRLVTVLNIENMLAEDGAAAAKNGFLYGPDPVVRVTVRCESLFMREWTTKWMPETVKTALGIPKPQPAQ